MRRSVVGLAVAGAVSAVVVAGCGGGSDKSSSSASAAPAALPATQKASITFWTGFTGRELGVVKQAVAGFEKAHPNITVKTVGAINDDKIIAATRGGNSPDVAMSFSTDNTGAFCSSGAFIDLGGFVKRDAVNLANIPKAPLSYTQFKGKRCAMPMLADVYGLYYNKAMFKAAGITAPPTNLTQLQTDAQKLTKSRGNTFSVVGFTPFMGFYENAAAHFAPSWNAQWQNAQGKSTLAASPGWSQMAVWLKKTIDSYGYDKLVKFQTGAGDEFSANNAFEKGKLAMMIDGEYRTAFIDKEAPKLQYGTAPFPVADAQANLYGGGYTTGSILGIPKGAGNQAAAWELVKYLSTNTAAEVLLANGLRNVPTWKPALTSPKLTTTPQFDVFLKISKNPNTTTNPITASGAANQELLEAYLSKYQAGKGGNLQSSLAKLDQQIDGQNQQAAGGSQVP